jgi:hypothetical protein
MATLDELSFEPDSVGPPLNNAHVQEVADYLELDFDPDFLALLARHNGGVPHQKFFRFHDNEKVVTRILCLVDDEAEGEECQDFDIEVAQVELDEILEDGLLPFAVIYAGDYLCFDYRNGLDRPRIVLLDHERSTSGKPHTMPVAAHFAEFLNMLHGENA